MAAIRYDGRWLILDNKTLEIREDVSAAQFDPLLVIDGEGVKRAEARVVRPQPQHPWADASLTAHQHISSGWQAARLLM